VAEPVKMSIPASVAVFVRPDIPVQERLRGAGGEVDLPSRELFILLFCLHKDAESSVRERARLTLQCLPDALFDCLTDWPEVHPAVLHTIAFLCGKRSAVREILLRHPGLSDSTQVLLRGIANEEAVIDGHADDAEKTGLDENAHGPAPQELEADDALDDEVDEDNEEYLSKYKLAQEMGIGEKIKMALTGDKEWRKILVKDANKLVSSGVVKNPRMTDSEVITVLKSGAQNDEIMRLICANKEWVKNYQIRKALIENPKTPLANALRYLSTMNDKDIASYAKSRNICSVIATQAKRIILNKKR
jgi:hypothetical protein